MEPKKLSKRNLEIIEVRPEKEFGQDGKKLLPLMARDLSLPQDDPLSGKGIDFVIFISALKDYMTSTPTKVIIVDYEERPNKNPEYGPNRSIQQIYVNGEPVSRKKQGWGKSAEIVRLENELKARSIEATVAVKEIGLLIREASTNGQVIDPNDKRLNRIIDKYWQTVELMLDNYTKPPVKRTERPPARQPAKTASPDEGLIKNAGDLLTRASKLNPPVSTAEILSMFSVNKVTDITDLDKAWETIQGLTT